ncbi:hypothetical protein ACLOJK_005622 [Asimina triloba]
MIGLDFSGAEREGGYVSRLRSAGKRGLYRRDDSLELVCEVPEELPEGPLTRISMVTYAILAWEKEALLLRLSDNPQARPRQLYKGGTRTDVERDGPKSSSPLNYSWLINTTPMKKMREREKCGLLRK